MGRQVYQEGDFKVYRAGHDFIVHNARYNFKEKHSHIRTLNIAKQIVYYAKKRIVPRGFSFYLLRSLIRVSDDERYIHELEDLIDVRKQKGPKQKYCNHTA